MLKKQKTASRRFSVIRFLLQYMPQSWATSLYSSSFERDGFWPFRQYLRGGNEGYVDRRLEDVRRANPEWRGHQLHVERSPVDGVSDLDITHTKCHTLAFHLSARRAKVSVESSDMVEPRVQDSTSATGLIPFPVKVTSTTEKPPLKAIFVLAVYQTGTRRPHRGQYDHWV